MKSTAFFVLVALFTAQSQFGVNAIDVKNTEAIDVEHKKAAKKTKSKKQKGSVKKADKKSEKKTEKKVEKKDAKKEEPASDEAKDEEAPEDETTTAVGTMSGADEDEVIDTQYKKI